jgi:hypothetical protein
MIWFFTFTSVGVAMMALLLVCQRATTLDLKRGFGGLLLLGLLGVVTSWPVRGALKGTTV